MLVWKHNNTLVFVLSDIVKLGIYTRIGLYIIAEVEARIFLCMHFLYTQRSIEFFASMINVHLLQQPTITSAGIPIWCDNNKKRGKCFLIILKKGPPCARLLFPLFILPNEAEKVYVLFHVCSSKRIDPFHHKIELYSARKRNIDVKAKVFNIHNIWSHQV